MKRILLSLMAVAAVLSSFAIDLEQQQKLLYAIAKDIPNVSNVGITPDHTANIIIYHKTQYQVTFDEVDGALKVTFSITGYKDPQDSFEPQAIQEATALNNLRYHAVKVNLETSRVGFEAQLYLKDITGLSPQAIQMILDNLTEAKNSYRTDVRQLSDKYRKQRLLAQRNDSIAAAEKAKADKIKNGDSAIVVKVEVPTDLRLQGPILPVNVDAHGKTVGDGVTFNLDNFKYVAFTFRAISPENRDYNIFVRITNSDGVPLLTSSDSKYTISYKVNAKKNKETVFLSPPFGSLSQAIWTPGIYKAEFFEGSAKIGEVSFAVDK